MRELKPRPFAGILVGILVISAGCNDGEKTSRGLDYMPDMYESPAFKSQQSMQVVLDKDGHPVDLPVMTDPGSVVPTGGKIIEVPAMLTPPAGTVPRDFQPYPYGKMDFLSPHSLLNPIEPTAEVLKIGQERYRISCAPCHGNDGNAMNGYVAAKFTGVPSLNAAGLALLTDGDIYHIISSGRNRMPDYRAQLLPEQRWAVIHYVRVLNGATLAKTDAAGALAEAKKALAATPSDAAARAVADAAQIVFDNATRDLELIKVGGKGEEFLPMPDPRPEYIKPSWSEE